MTFKEACCAGMGLAAGVTVGCIGQHRTLEALIWLGLVSALFMVQSKFDK